MPLANCSLLTPTYPFTNAFLNVQDWGATGNGTTDDDACIKAAIAASKPGDTIVFPGFDSTRAGQAIYMVHGDIHTLPQRGYIGTGGPCGQGPILRVMAGYNHAGILVANQYYTGGTSISALDAPVYIFNLQLDGNAGASNGTTTNTYGHGLILYNYQSTVEQVQTYRTCENGFFLPNANKNNLVPSQVDFIQIF
jgi:hypothetical protein